MPENAPQPRHVVTVVVVVHDGARLLPGLAAALRQQTHPVHRAVGVDTGSRDRSGALLTELLGPDAVFGMDSGTGYGAAVARALEHPAARRPVPGTGPLPTLDSSGRANPQDPSAEWIWLLHDDCEPAPDALEQMLRAAGRNRSVAVLGPKLRDLADRRVLRETGVTADRAGRRFTGIEPGELDQGQHDGNRSVLAVSSAGMLIRRDVWEQVGGFDPNLPLMRDDIDFCWRVHAAGYDVRVITDAVVYHRELSTRQIRRAPAAGGRPRLADRRGALYVFAVNLPLRPMLAIVGGCVGGSLLRAAYFLLTKQQRRAFDHLGAIGWLLRHPVVLWRARRRRAAGRRRAWSVLRGEVPRGRTLARLAESAAGLLSGGPAYPSGGQHHALIDDVSDDMPLPATDSAVRRAATNPGVLLALGLILVALVAERSLVSSVLSGSGTLAGGALVPAWGGASDLWREYLAGYHAVGIGSAASAPPYVGLMAALATVLAGKPWLAVDAVLFGCVPAAGITAFLAARRITRVPAARVWAAATYALLPVASGVVASGRIGTAVAFVLLPLIGLAVWRMQSGRWPASPSRFTPRRAAWAAGLLIAVAAAFAPLIWLIAVVAAVAVIAAWPWLGRATAINAAIVAAVPAAILVPWTFHLFARPSAVFLEAGVSRPGLASAGLRPESVLLLSPGGPGLPPAWVTAGLVLPAFCALLVRRRMPLVYAGWAVALGGLVVALVVSRVRVSPPGGTAVNAWPGIASAVAAAGLLLAATPLIEAAVMALPRTRDHLAVRLSRVDGRGLAALAGLAVAASAPALAAGYWLAAGVRGPVTAAGPQILPPFVAASSSGPARTRTLVLRQNGPVLSYAVLRNSDPVLGDPELTEASSATRALDGTVASLGAATGGDGGDPGQALSQFDIGYVLLPAPIDQTLARQLDGAAGLIQLTSVPAYDLWQVAGTVARARVITADGTVVAVPSGPVGVNTVVAPGTSGTLVLAEAAGGWSAALNGKPLAALRQPVDGWAQGFVLPAGGGRLVITRDDLARDLSLGGEAAAVIVVFALALPGTRAAGSAAAAEAAGDAGAAPDRDASPVPPRRRERASRPKLPSRRRQRRPQPALTAGRPRDAVGSGWTGHHAAEPGPALAPPASDAEVTTPRRSRGGGQHAAKHGKPSRRGRSPAETPEPDPVLETAVSVPATDDGAPAHNPVATGQRPPWELGDPG